MYEEECCRRRTINYYYIVDMIDITDEIAKVKVLYSFDLSKKLFHTFF